MQYIFIMGCGHSGTSLMLSYFTVCDQAITIKTETGFLLSQPLSAFKMRYTPLVIDKKNVLVEKTPRHVHALSQVCRDSDSKALIMVRNPVDTIASLCKRGITFNQAITRYVNDNLAWIKFANNSNVIAIRYEDLVENETETVTTLSQRLNVDLMPSIRKRTQIEETFFDCPDIKLTDGKGEKNHLMLRNFQMRQPVSNQNGKWKERLNESELEQIKRRCEPFINLFEYQEVFSYSF